MSKQRMQEEGMRNAAQNNRGGREANPAKKGAQQPATKRGHKRKAT